MKLPKYAALLILLALAAGGYFFWRGLMSPYGKQRAEYSPAVKECFTVPGVPDARYCIYTPASGTNGDLAYFFHGRNMSENSWNDGTYYTGMVQQYWQRHDVRPPVIAAVSFGPTWLLTPATGAPKSGLLDVFLDKVMPEVEKRAGRPRTRIVIGDSMGGLNALIAGLKTEGVFQRIIALYPPIYRVSPFSTRPELKDFLARTGADPKTIYAIVALAKYYMPGEEEWKAVSPAALIENGLPSPRPEIYLSCGLYDHYGNFEAAEYFAKKAAEQGVKLTWRPLYGGHCTVDIASVADMLAK